MGKFKLISNYKPTGDQPEAIKELVKGLKGEEKFQTLLGITGSGKTFTIANVIAQWNILSVITIIINRKHIFPEEISISKKMLILTARSRN